MQASLWTSVVTNLRAVIGMLAGLAICGSGVALLIQEVQIPTGIHKEHVYIAAGLIGFGALLIVPSTVRGAAKEGAAIVGTYVPVFGGRRPADPPPPSEPMRQVPPPPTLPPDA